MDPAPAAPDTAAVQDVPPAPAEPAVAGATLPRKVRLARSRTTTLFGGLILFAGFFLPAVDSCNKPVYPIVDFAEAVRDGALTSQHGPGAFSMFVSPYAFGLLAALGAGFALRGRDRAATCCSGLATAIVGFASATFTVSIFVDGVPFDLFWANSFEDLCMAGLIVSMLLGLLAWIYALRAGAAGRLSARWIGAWLAIVWFAFWALGGIAYFGLWLSMFGALLIGVGAVGEAKAFCRTRTIETILRLAPCRLRYRPLDDGLCDGCGYPLVGLPERRCPECGLRF